MIKKEELIILLKQGLNTEEKAIPIYAKHLDSVLFLSGLSKEKQEKVRDILKVLKGDSERHKIIYEDLIKTTEESSRDVF